MGVNALRIANVAWQIIFVSKDTTKQLNVATTVLRESDSKKYLSCVEAGILQTRIRNLPCLSLVS